jgi:hypothetical protein
MLLSGPAAREYQDRPLSFTEFVELFRLFTTRMRKDLKDLFNDFAPTHSTTNSHVPKRSTEKSSPRVQSRLESLSSSSPANEFIPDDILTRK